MTATVVGSTVSFRLIQASPLMAVLAQGDVAPQGVAEHLDRLNRRHEVVERVLPRSRNRHQRRAAAAKARRRA
ncbi:hypothetical protein [Methylobacterium sp. SD21]|uniref:hypothetical protein n=1 Tax=Methylobacterium litchii TaxID=3138810 RepID=UPI00313CB314